MGIIIGVLIVMTVFELLGITHIYIGFENQRRDD